MTEERLHEVVASLAEMSADAATPPDPAAVTRARTLMHAAVDGHASEAASPVPAWKKALQAVRQHVRLTGAAVATAGAVAVVALGWSAPAGSPLHEVRLVRESVALHLPGANDAALTLGYVEDRLADAAAGRDPQASLAEASSLLASCRSYLPTDHSDPLWQRWAHDDAELARLEAQLAPSQPSGGYAVPHLPTIPAGQAGPVPSGTGGSQPAQQSSHENESAGSRSSSSSVERSGGASATATSTENETSEGGSQGGSGRAPSTTFQTTTSTSESSTDSHSSDGGGSDGGVDRDGGSGTTSSTTSDGGSH